MSTVWNRRASNTIAGLLIGIFFFSPLVVAPQRAEAAPLLVPVTAPVAEATLVTIEGTEAEESFVYQVLNGIAWAAAKAVVNSLTQSIVNWVNSGFEGSPAFATDLNTNLRQLGDAVATDFLNDLLTDTGKGDMIQSPFAESIGEGIIAGYYLYTSGDRLAARLRYTLDNFSQNSQAFLSGDFSQGGWNAFSAANNTCGNNPYCSRFAAYDELIDRLDSQVNQRIEEFRAGNGFLSWRGDCKQYASGSTSTPLKDSDACLGHTINTPGSVIEAQLEHTLGSGLRQLELADSINEIVGALVSQLVTQVIGGTGLLGSSESTAGGGRSLTDSIGQNTNTNTNANAALAEKLDDHETQINSYGGSWQKIRAAALGAKTELESCLSKGTNQQVLNSDVIPLIARADAAIADAASAIAEIERIRTMLGQPGQTAAASEAYSLLLNTGPSNTEIGEAVTQASSNPELGDTLYVQMTTLEETACDSTD